MSQAPGSNGTVQPAADQGAGAQFVSFTLSGQLFGIPVLQVRDVLNRVEVTPTPLTPPEILGSLNLRGRIVTAIDLGRRLGLATTPAAETGMSIVVEDGGELYSLRVDAVGEVLSLSASAFEPKPPTLDSQLRAFAAGIYRLEGQLLIALDVGRLMDYRGTSGRPDEAAGEGRASSGEVA